MKAGTKTVGAIKGNSCDKHGSEQCFNFCFRNLLPISHREIIYTLLLSQKLAV